jgi:uncharacterized protein
MKKKTSLSVILLSVLSLVGISILTSFINAGENVIPVQPRVLVFSKTNGYRHESIEAGIEAIKKLGAENNFLVNATEDSVDINDANLSSYQSIIFLSTTMKVLGESEEKALQNFIHKGGGFAGIHAATDCEYNFPWYVQMVGASFESHPKQQTAKLMVVDNKHISTKHLPAVWERKDEWYNFKNMNPDVKVLIKIDETSYEGGKNGGNHPMAWYHDFEGGRVFYTELGHTKESYTEAMFLQHILGGIQYSLGVK